MPDLSSLHVPTCTGLPARTIDIGMPHTYATGMANRKVITSKVIGETPAESIRRQKLDQLKALSGKIHLDLDWKKLEQAEIRHQASLRRRRHGHR